MDDYCDSTYDGWSEAMAAAEPHCVRVWYENGVEGWAVPRNVLIGLRHMPELAKKGQNDG